MKMLMYNYFPLSLLLSAFFLIAACSPNTDNPENWSEERLSQWFDQKDWLGQLQLQPDASIDRREFAIRYHQNQERWDKAFAFLREEDLSALEVGNHELDGTDVFVIVFEYDSRNPEDVQHETHKIYTDIHYVVSGTENIVLTDLSATSVKTPYDEERDIAFHHVEQSQKLLADPGTFFIFFPGTVHGPGLKVEESIPVKKIVIKVRH